MTTTEYQFIVNFLFLNSFQFFKPPSLLKSFSGKLGAGDACLLLEASEELKELGTAFICGGLISDGVLVSKFAF